MATSHPIDGLFGNIMLNACCRNAITPDPEDILPSMELITFMVR